MLYVIFMVFYFITVDITVIANYIILAGETFPFAVTFTFANYTFLNCF